MQVILKRPLGKHKIGSIVEVKDGYARNYLLPQDMAMRATKENIAIFETQREHIEQDNQEKFILAKKQAETLEGMMLKVIRQAGEDGHLFGSVNTKDIVEAIAEKSIELHKRMVVMVRPIKTIGIHDVILHLHPEVDVKIQLNVSRTDEEAEKLLQDLLEEKKRESEPDPETVFAEMEAEKEQPSEEPSSEEETQE